MRSRVSKVTYGSFSYALYDPSDPDHISRSHNILTSAAGEKEIEGFFSIILPKVSCLFPYLKSTYLKKLLFRIPKLRRRRNSEDVIT